jgi:hypothetical protein
VRRSLYAEYLDRLALLDEDDRADVLARVPGPLVVGALAGHGVDQVVPGAAAGRSSAEGGAGLERAPRLPQRVLRPGADLVDKSPGAGVALRIGRNRDTTDGHRRCTSRGLPRSVFPAPNRASSCPQYTPIYYYFQHLCTLNGDLMLQSWAGGQ